MNSRLKKFIHLLIIEYKLEYNKIIEIWDRSNDIKINYKYSLYIKKNYKDIKLDNPEYDKKQIMNILHENWLKMSEEEKMKYMYIEDKKQQKLSSYHSFLKYQYPKIKDENKEWTFGVIIKKISSLWNKMSEKEKSKFGTVSNDSVQQQHESINNYFKDDQKKYDRLIIEKMKKEDPFLTNDEKNDIDNICCFFAEKTDNVLKRLFENNYDESLSDHITKDEIIEKIYKKERLEKIRSFWDTKKKLFPDYIIQKHEYKNYIDSLYQSNFDIICDRFKGVFPNKNTSDKKEMIELLSEYFKEKIYKSWIGL